MAVDFWRDWQFWDFAITGASALLGFAGGTIVKYRLNRRRDRAQDGDAARNLAVALHAEIVTINTACLRSMRRLGGSDGVEPDVMAATQVRGLPPAIIYDANASGVGLLPANVCARVVAFYQLRADAERAVQAGDALDRAEVLASLLTLSVAAAAALAEVESFNGQTAASTHDGEPITPADLPVRNGRPAVVWDALSVAEAA